MLRGCSPRALPLAFFVVRRRYKPSFVARYASRIRDLKALSFKVSVLTLDMIVPGTTKNGTISDETINQMAAKQVQHVSKQVMTVSVRRRVPHVHATVKGQHLTSAAQPSPHRSC